jgi:hypothetical protein
MLQVQLLTACAVLFLAGPLGRRTPVKASTVVIPAFEGINTALQRQPRHPMASHLLIHLTEGGTPGPASSATMRPGYAGDPQCCCCAAAPIVAAKSSCWSA